MQFRTAALAAVAVAVSFFTFFPALQADFTNWDDDRYIIDNPHINGPTVRHIGSFFRNYYVGNYQPLTMISLSLDYEDPPDARRYHATNLVLHLLNVLLVFHLSSLLAGRGTIALTAALLFGVHPMHVESVAWVSGRKDLLYSLFFVSALCAYVRYVIGGRRQTTWYLATTTLFFLSLLSKGQAVVFPGICAAIDVFFERKFSVRTVGEKIPWLGGSLLFGFVAIKAQQSASALPGPEFLSGADRVILATFGLVTYLGKLLVPVNLSCFYRFPARVDGAYPPAVYLGMILVPLLFLGVWKYFRNRRFVVFAFSFFLISISVVVQLVPVGAAIIADRYTYLAYLGFFLLAGKIVADSISMNPEHLGTHRTSRLIRLGGLAIAGMTLVFVFLARERVHVWRDSVTLWTDAISKDETSPLLFINRAKAYGDKREYDLAIADLDKAIALKPDYAAAYYNRGLSHYYKNQYDKAIADYTLAIRFNPRLAVAWQNRSVANFAEGRVTEALEDAKKAQDLMRGAPP